MNMNSLRHGLQRLKILEMLLKWRGSEWRGCLRRRKQMRSLTLWQKLKLVCFLQRCLPAEIFMHAFKVFKCGGSGVEMEEKYHICKSEKQNASFSGHGDHSFEHVVGIKVIFCSIVSKYHCGNKISRQIFVFQSRV